MTACTGASMTLVVLDVQAKLWQCFLKGATNRLRHHYVHGGTVDVTGIDAAKLACCLHASTSRCHQLCQQVGLGLPFTANYPGQAGKCNRTAVFFFLDHRIS